MAYKLIKEEKLKVEDVPKFRKSTPLWEGQTGARWQEPHQKSYIHYMWNSEKPGVIKVIELNGERFLADGQQRTDTNIKYLSKENILEVDGLFFYQQEEKLRNRFLGLEYAVEIHKCDTIEDAKEFFDMVQRGVHLNATEKNHNRHCNAKSWELVRSMANTPLISGMKINSDRLACETLMAKILMNAKIISNQDGYKNAAQSAQDAFFTSIDKNEYKVRPEALRFINRILKDMGVATQTVIGKISNTSIIECLYHYTERYVVNKDGKIPPRQKEWYTEMVNHDLAMLSDRDSQLFKNYSKSLSNLRGDHKKVELGVLWWVARGDKFKNKIKEEAA